MDAMTSDKSLRGFDYFLDVNIAKDLGGLTHCSSCAKYVWREAPEYACMSGLSMQV